jgi:hypothetical protein
MCFFEGIASVEAAGNSANDRTVDCIIFASSFADFERHTNLFGASIRRQWFVIVRAVT